MPYGTSSEIMSIDVLKKVVQYIKIPQNSEYLEYIIDNKMYFNVNYVFSKYKFDKTIKNDLYFIKKIYYFLKKFSKNFIKNIQSFQCLDVLNYLNSNNKIVKINNYQKS